MSDQFEINSISLKLDQMLDGPQNNWTETQKGSKLLINYIIIYDYIIN